MKYLTTVEFFLSLAKVQGPSLRYFKPAFDVAFRAPGDSLFRSL